MCKHQWKAIEYSISLNLSGATGLTLGRKVHHIELDYITLHPFLTNLSRVVSHCIYINLKKLKNRYWNIMSSRAILSHTVLWCTTLTAQSIATISIVAHYLNISDFLDILRSQLLPIWGFWSKSDTGILWYWRH